MLLTSSSESRAKLGAGPAGLLKKRLCTFQDISVELLVVFTMVTCRAFVGSVEKVTFYCLMPFMTLCPTACRGGDDFHQ